MNFIKKNTSALVICIMIAAITIAFFKMNNKEEKTTRNTVSTSNINSELKEHTFKQHDNITFNCNTENIVIGEVYDNVDVTIFPEGINMSDKTFKKNACDLFDKLNRADKTDTSKFEYDEEDNDYCYSDDDILFDYFNTGSMIWVDYREMSDDAREYDPGYSDVVKRIKADDIDPDESYNVGGDNYSLKDAADFVHKKLEELSEYLHVHSPILSNIAVIYIPEKDEYCYLLRYNTTIDGIPTDDSGVIDTEDDFLRGNYLDVELRRKDSISLICNLANFHIDRRGDETDIIPLDQAEDIVSQTLAPESKYVCTDCRLKYVCEIKGSDHQKSTAVYKPMWVFTIEEDKSKEYDFRGDNFRKNNLYIDAVTGDAFIYDHISNQIVRDVNSYK